MNRTIDTAKDLGPSESARNDVKDAREAFVKAMDDDLNTADGIAAVFELVRRINTALADKEITKGDISVYLDEFTALTNVLGLLYNNSDDEIPSDILELLEQRKAARKAKDFALADKLRDEITSCGYIVEETRQGTVIKKA